LLLNHSYLLEPGLWEVEGIYMDEGENQHRQTGQLLVAHTPELWTIDSQLKVSGEDRRDFISRYEITPLKSPATFTEWKSMTGGPEPIFGLFVLVHDCIMVPWQSRTGVYLGQEVLAQKSAEEYLSRGFAFIKEKKVSSWSVKMTR